MHEEISRYLVKLRRSHPFFASLSLFADYQFTDDVDGFDTNGRTIRLESDHFFDLNVSERSGLLLHLVLHCALLHAVRRGRRDENIWNIASDIVVNNIILDGSDLTVPCETVTDRSYAGYSVEQVYEALSKSSDRTVYNSNHGQMSDNHANHNNQALSATASDTNSSGSTYSDYQRDLDYPQSKSTLQSDAPQQKLESHWKGAIQKALITDRLNSTQSRGEIPAGLQREIDAITHPELDWRTLLWRFLVRTPNDYTGFDRRFLYTGLYLDNLEGESLNVDIAVDTSGSIDDTELRSFLSEVNSIVRAYQHINARIYYIDAAVHGPFPLSKHQKPAVPVGGGGTDFTTFFSATEDIDNQSQAPLCIYFTDGDGFFPAHPPKREILWVVTRGGMPNSYFPFGEVSRLAN